MKESVLIAKRHGYETSHVLHLLLTIISMGLWLPIWVLVSVSNANERRKIDKQLNAL